MHPTFLESTHLGELARAVAESHSRRARPGAESHPSPAGREAELLPVGLLHTPVLADGRGHESSN